MVEAPKRSAEVVNDAMPVAGSTVGFADRGTIGEEDDHAGGSARCGTGLPRRLR